MAYYSRDELQEIVLRLANKECEPKYTKHEKLGVVFTPLAGNKFSDLYCCETCKKHLLSSHLLNLHVAEHHDSFFQLQKDRKPSVSFNLFFFVYWMFKKFCLQYACYLEDCKIMLWTHSERKDHAIKYHKFPHDFYDFKHIIEKKLNPKYQEDVVMEASNSSTELPKSSIINKEKSNYFQFGHKANKSFQSKPHKNKDISMNELMDVLPS